MRSVSDEKVFHADTKVFCSKLFYHFLEIVVKTICVIAVIAVVAYIIPVKSIHDLVFQRFQKVIVGLSPVFPFSILLIVEFLFVLLIYVLRRQKVLVSDHGIVIRRWRREKTFLYEQGKLSFSHEQKVYWKRNEIEYYVILQCETSEGEEEIHELFCFDRSTVQQLEDEVRMRKKRAAGVIMDESDTEFLQTKPVTIYIPKDKILGREWKVTGWSFAGGIAACGVIGFLLYRYHELWGYHASLRLFFLMVLIFLTVVIRLARTAWDQKRVPERIYISGEYLRVDGANFWLKDVGQIEFSEKKFEKDRSEQNRWYFRFLYRGRKKCYWLGTESSFSIVKFNQMKREIRESLGKYPEKLVK